MTPDPAFEYFLVGKTTAQHLTHGQVAALSGMQEVFTCADFSGYSGPPDWTLPAYWQSGVSSYPSTPPNFNPAWMFSVSGVHENDLAQLEVITKYTTPTGEWADISETSGGPANNTGLFLVGVKGSVASSMSAETYGDGGISSFTSPSVGYAYSNTDGGQRIYVTALDPLFFEASIDQVKVYAAYDGVPPAPPTEFWTSFVGSREIV